MVASASFFSEFFLAKLSHLTNLITLDMTDNAQSKLLPKRIENGEDQTYSIMKY